MEPICKIRLPSHHPAVKDLKKGERVHLEAERAEDSDPITMPGEKSKGPTPPPLEHPFHVMAITKGKGKAAPPAKGKPTSPMDYLKSKRSAPAPAAEQDAD